MSDIPILRVLLPFNTKQRVECHSLADFMNSITGMRRQVSVPLQFDTDVAYSLEEDAGVHWEDWYTTACSKSLRQIFIMLVTFFRHLSLMIMCTGISVKKMPQSS